ncbi:hypothetical protein [uncultured Chryseobacterium sp.]|uniref:hypothetical protein n=1 Tax=uncultured Chryseobacterium sp. TaxID=259322 RepID=UPI0025D78CD4|nr:hypothetical protein [uncultured Chryseobacterium sp.]
MKDNNLYTILDLIEEIQNVDKMIDIHSHSKSKLMFDQYTHQKLKLTTVLIEDLIAHTQDNQDVMYLVKLLIERFYGNVLKNPKSIEEDHNLKKIKEAFL